MPTDDPRKIWPILGSVPRFGGADHQPEESGALDGTDDSSRHFYNVRTETGAKTPQDAMAGRLINVHTVHIYRRCGYHKIERVACLHLQGDDPNPRHMGTIICEGLDRGSK